MTDNVIPLPGVPANGNVEIFDKQVASDKAKADVLEFLEDMIERVKAGEVVGIGAAMLHSDRCGSWRLVGRIGGFSHLGAADVVRQCLLETARGDE